MFRVKICGITNPEDALAVARAGGDAIGLNFYAQSPRFCGIEQAKQIVSSLPSQVLKVGVFVNSPAQEIRSIFAAVGLDIVQVHGDETPEFLTELKGLPVLKAFRISDDLSPVGEYLRRCYQLACVPRMALVDAYDPRQHGGTGNAVDWQVLAKGRSQFAGIPLVLAGGLNPSNVDTAIATVRPWAVDTASGVEVSPGKKSPQHICEFVAAAKNAFAQLNTGRFRRSQGFFG